VAYVDADAQTLITRVQELYAERYGTPDEDVSEAAMFTPPAGAFFVGYLDGAPVATGAWRRAGVERLGTSATAEIKRMYVVPEAQRRGLARRMLAHLEASAAAAGHEALILFTGALQPEAIELYRSSGYETVEPFGHYADSELVRAYGKVLTVRAG